MQIRKVSYQGVKGLSFEWQPAALSAIVGPMGAGKTAHLIGLRYAFNGDVPAGKTNDAAAMYGGPLGFDVTVELENGFTWSRGIVRKTKAKRVEALTSCSGVPKDANLGTINEEIHKHIGRLPVMFNLSEFTNLSAERKRQAVIELCAKFGKPGKGSLSDQTMIALVNSKLGIKVKTAASARKVLWENLDQECYARVCEAIGLPEARNTLEGCLEALANAVQQTKDTRAEHNEAQAAVRDLSDTLARKIMPQAEHDELLEEIAELRQHVTKCHGDAEYARGIAKSLEQAQARLRAAQERVAAREAAIEQARQDIAGNADRLQSLKQDRERLDAEIRSMGNPHEALQSANGEMAKLQQKSANAAERMSRLKSDIMGAEKNIAHLEASLAGESSSDWRKVLKCCDDYESDSKSTHPIIERIRKIAVGHVDTQAIERIGRDIDVEREVLEKASEARDSLSAEIEAVNDDIESAHKRIADAQDAVAAYDSKTLSLRNTEQEIAALEKANDYLDELRSELSSAQEELVETTRAVNQHEQPARLEDLNMAAARSEQRIETLLAECKKYDDAAATQRIIDETSQRVERRMAEHEACKAVVKALEIVREGHMSDMVKPLLARMRPMLPPDMHPYCDLVNERGRPIFTLGVDREEQRVAFESLSGGETALMHAALLFALVGMSDAPVKFIGLECAEVPVQDVMMLCNRIKAACTGVDHVAICHWHPEAATCAGWNAVAVPE